MPSTDNLLFYGDNLDVLRRHVADESVDLVYGGDVRQVAETVTPPYPSRKRKR